MTKLYSYIVLILITGLIPFLSRSTHIMGGEITWTCQGNGSYIFELVVYRDCNGFDVSTGVETIDVWNHPSVNSIGVSFVQREDLSPSCTQVGGGPLPFSCGSGPNAGNGSGALEKITYRSSNIMLPGNPGAAGWIFTYESFSRSQNLTNIQNPTNVGITVVAKMFSTGANGACNDSSPRFFENPFVVACAGTPFVYNQNSYDPDLDSMVFSWGVPLDLITTAYTPPSDPAPVTFEPGFAYNNPTPDATINPGNIPAALDSQTGELSFTSFTIGNYALKVLVQSYRNGTLISEIQREIQVIVESCATPNAPPQVTAPFPGNSYEIDVFAGDPVNFSIYAEDFDLLQDGTPQSVEITASGAQFGAGYTNATTGCPNPPCATLNTPIPVSGTPSAQVDFSWQTDCNHLIGATGNAQSSVPYSFVFKVKDDLCQIPAVRYATVTINVKNSSVLPPSEIECIQVQPNGDTRITWEEATDPGGAFDSYEIYSIQDGLLATQNTITSNTFVHVGAGGNTTSKDYYIITKSGCNGATAVSSDTISSLFMVLNNPGNGTAVIQWNTPSTPQSPNWNDYYYIEREYPTGTWTVVDSVRFGLTSHTDTIDICSAFLNYRVSLPTETCSFVSNTDGDNFEDQIGPNIPEIYSVSIDTLSGQVQITWNENEAPDTYGYIVYAQDENGFYTELDTLWGIGSTTYSTGDFPTGEGPLSFSVAAFDSCYTPQIPPTFQTSAKANVHRTNFLSGELDICDQQVDLSWTEYASWDEGVETYRIFGYSSGNPWTQLETTSESSISIDVETDTRYCFVIEALSNEGKTAFSNSICLDIVSPDDPDVHYLSTATVQENGVLIKHRTSLPVNDGALILQRWNEKDEVFEDIETRTVTANEELFIDEEVNPSKQSYIYRVVAIDSCGRPSLASNIGKTIFLETFADDNNMKVYLQWSLYKDWKGPILGYQIHRGVMGLTNVIDPIPIATLPPNSRSYEDNVEDYLSTSNGRFCYFVVAVEGTNALNISETSTSNSSCEVLEPLIYIPNAFTVGGKNPIFRPVVNLFDFTNYEFTVFDRWGQTIFRTNDPAQGWEGFTRDRSIAKEGVYMYVLRLKDGNGNEVTRRGHVTLLDYRAVE